MRLLVLTEIDAGVAKSRVGEIVFVGSVDVLPSLHVISLDIGIRDAEVTVQHILELIYQLHFIQQNVVHLTIGHLRIYVFKQDVWIAQLLVPPVLQVYHDDMLVIHSLRLQIVLEDVEQQESGQKSTFGSIFTTSSVKSVPSI